MGQIDCETERRTVGVTRQAFDTSGQSGDISRSREQGSLLGRAHFPLSRLVKGYGDSGWRVAGKAAKQLGKAPFRCRMQDLGPGPSAPRALWQLMELRCLMAPLTNCWPGPSRIQRAFPVESPCRDSQSRLRAYRHRLTASVAPAWRLVLTCVLRPRIVRTVQPCRLSAMPPAVIVSLLFVGLPACVTAFPGRQCLRPRWRRPAWGCTCPCMAVCAAGGRGGVSKEECRASTSKTISIRA